MSREWFLELSNCFVDKKYHLLTLQESSLYYQIGRHSKKNFYHFEHFYFLGQVRIYYYWPLWLFAYSVGDWNGDLSREAPQYSILAKHL